MSKKIIWRASAFFPNLYKVSSEGIISVSSGDIPLKTVMDREGRRTVALLTRRGNKIYYVDEVVAATFLKNPNNCTAVHHINGNLSDDRIDNLKWAGERTRELKEDDVASQAYNHRANRAGRPGKMIEQLNLDGKTVIKTWESMKATHGGGFNPNAVSACIGGRREHHKGFKWRYKTL